jgi:hypothetical protein
MAMMAGGQSKPNPANMDSTCRKSCHHTQTTGRHMPTHSCIGSTLAHDDDRTFDSHRQLRQTTATPCTVCPDPTPPNPPCLSQQTRVLLPRTTPMLRPARLIFRLLSHTPTATKPNMARAKDRNKSHAVFGHVRHVLLNLPYSNTQPHTCRVVTAMHSVNASNKDEGHSDAKVCP